MQTRSIKTSAPEKSKEPIEFIDWSHLESLLSDEDKILYVGMKGDQAKEFLITNPRLDPTTARNLRVRYVLLKAVEEGRISPSDISLHDSLFHQLGQLSMKETRTEEGENQAIELRERLDTLWKKADPTNSSHRLAIEYARRSSIIPAVK